jgi:endonuclease YncB( thermonuclease family)
MDRRDFLASLAGSVAATTGIAAGTGAASTGVAGIEPVAFDSAASLLDADGRRLDDESTVAVWAASTASNEDGDSAGDAVSYSGRVPMVAVDGDVVGFGGPFVTDRDPGYGNEEFYLNALDEHVDGSVVLVDESHDQYYDLTDFERFAGYAEANGYTVSKTTRLVADLERADGLILTSPGTAISDRQKRALREFVDDGGALFLHDQGDTGGYDETDRMNAVADTLDLDFRFNDDRVIDRDSNAGADYKPVTDRFTATADPYTDARSGLSLSPEETYEVTVMGVPDGDTVNVRMPSGAPETIRLLGADTPEVAQFDHHERVQEWEGIDAPSYLVERAEDASRFAKRTFRPGDTVELSFDPDKGVRGDFDRLLGYVRVDGRLYNRALVEEGYARVYDSGFDRHDDFLERERGARRAGRGVWADADVESTPVVRDDPFDELYVPDPVSVTTEFGDLSDDRVPLRAPGGDDGGLFGADDTDAPIEADFWDWLWPGDDDSTGEDGDTPTVTATGDGPPLVGVDEDAGVAVVGGPLVAERYEQAEGYDVDTAGYGNFPFLTNLIDYLGSGEGDVLIDGGHGQFEADYALSAEDAAYYKRYLEGFGVGFEQFNDLADPPWDLGEFRAVVVTTPSEAFSRAEVDALREFADSGGAVVLMGAAGAPADARRNLDELAADLGTDLRLGEAVDAPDHELDADPTAVATDAFGESFSLFDPYGSSPDDPGDGGDGGDGGDDGGDDGDDGGDDDPPSGVIAERTGELRMGGEETFTVETAAVDRVTVEMESDSGADLDLYATGDGRTPTQDDYDAASTLFGGEESVTLAAGDELGVLVNAMTEGDGFTVTVRPA